MSQNHSPFTIHHSLTLTQQRRYARQIMLPEFGEARQRKLLDARVLVIGAGGLGSALISYLAAAGVGTIGVIDPDRVELSNLARQILHETGDIGRLKVESASDRVAEINPEVRIITYPFALTEENALQLLSGAKQRDSAESPPPEGEGWGGGFICGKTAPKLSPPPTPPSGGRGSLRDVLLGASLTIADDFTAYYDVVADGCDNFATRFAVNRTCLQLKLPLVSAAIAGWSGQVMTIAPHLARHSGCYQCLVSPDAPEANTCRESGVIGPLAGVIGSMQALEVVNTILEKPALLGKLAIYDGRTMTQRVVDVPRDAGCPICGEMV